MLATEVVVLVAAKVRRLKGVVRTLDQVVEPPELAIEVEEHKGAMRTMAAHRDLQVTRELVSREHGVHGVPGGAPVLIVARAQDKLVELAWRRKVLRSGYMGLHHLPQRTTGTSSRLSSPPAAEDAWRGADSKTGYCSLEAPYRLRKRRPNDCL